MARQRLTDILKAWGLIDAKEEAQAVAAHRLWGVRVGEALVGLGLCPRENVVRALAAQAGLQAVDLGRVRPEPSAVALVPQAVARRYQVLPLSLGAPGERVLIMAMAAPVSAEVLEVVHELAGRKVMVFIGEEETLARMITRTYEGGDDSERSVELRAEGLDEGRKDGRPPLLDIPLIEYVYGGAA